MSAGTGTGCPALNTYLPFAIADISGALFVGAFITLSTICIILLSLKTGGTSKQRRLLQLYIVTLIIAVIGFFISDFVLTNVSTIFNPHTEEDGLLLVRKLVIPVDVFQTIVIFMTDGLLVWRCYMVREALMGQSSESFWGKISCGIPACLWFMSVVTGVITCTRLEQALPTAILFIFNALTNICGTAFITIHLLRHRQMARICFGDEAPTDRKYHNIVGILLESAAINVPVAICAVVGSIITMTQNLTPINWQIVYSISVPSQAFATVLVILQVALGRVIGQRAHEDPEAQRHVSNREEAT
ncbi:hypothetical protein P691DRAFT_760314 [Macrolepiota fuliginosa MF-IS2]|uniref:Uncharacterized protein n=1 Tax=Macrolepiota fuliginosa MF-IS2 TaxID=1400762 RepID=A0A9P6C3Q7_9AGAR|nr:hypothetical protein P691DRAFT_760314 [Macrolepiota fuliginosa MF-IS2]